MWGVVIGLGVAMALTPLCPLAAIILLSLQRGVRKASAFFLGKFAVVFGIGALTVASRPASWVTLVAGAGLLLVGAWLAVRARRATEVEEPPWLARLDRMEPWPAFLLGMFLPTHLIAIAAGAHVVGTTHPGAAALVV